MMKNTLSRVFITGFFEADGGFIVIFKKDSRSFGNYRVQPQIKVTQKNTAILLRIAEECDRCNIKWRIYPTTGKGKTTPYLLVEGFKACQSFMRLLDLNSLCGVKLYSYFLLQQLFSLKNQGLHNTPLGRGQVIDIKMQLHQLPPCEEFWVENNLLYKRCNNQTLSLPLAPAMARALSAGLLSKEGVKKVTGGLKRSCWERRHGLVIGNTVGTAEKRIRVSAKAYFARFWRTVWKGVAPSSEYIFGLMVGDGCFSFTRGGKDKNKHPIFTLTIESGSELILWCTATYFKDDKPRIYAAKGCNYYRGERRELIQKMVSCVREGSTHFDKKNLLQFVENT